MQPDRFECIACGTGRNAQLGQSFVDHAGGTIFWSEGDLPLLDGDSTLCPGRAIIIGLDVEQITVARKLDQEIKKRRA